MEIFLYKAFIGFFEKFKIDLIVWKFLNFLHNPIQVLLFKIDLIVWKL